MTTSPQDETTHDGHAAVDLSERLSRFEEHWSPKVVARFNDYEVKVVKVQGEFVWHLHDDTDELFLVLDGVLTIEMRDSAVTLGPGSLFVVPRGVEHHPVASGEVHALLIEPRGVVNTGSAGGPMTSAHHEMLQ
jgi:mannose-6-phosphate isomerase-like protein (cupin superfamily)